MCWLPIVHNLAIEPYVVQIMGTIHYLFIAGQEDENAYLPVAQKNAVSHPVTIWTVKDKLT